MTTTRDDIAGLAAWLNGLAAKGGKGVVNNIDARSIGRIATQLDALSARVKELERDIEAFHRHEQTLRDNGIGSHSEAVARVVDAEARATRAEQERDEAYERAAEVAGEKSVCLPHYDDLTRGYALGRGEAAATIRRLASGHEK